MFCEFYGASFFINIKQLKIDKIIMDDIELNFDIDEKKQLLIIKFDEHKNINGKKMMNIRYTGELNDDLCGLYRSTYNYGNKEYS